MTVSLFLFAFTTLLGNYFYAETGLLYMFGENASKKVVMLQRILAIVIVLAGSVLSLNVVWDTADVFMGMMAIINVPVLFLLLKPAIRCLDDYLKQKKAGKNPVFKAQDIDLKEETDFWK